MGLFKRKEKRGAEEEEAYSAFLSALRTSDTITETEALGIPAVAGCVEFISSMVACQPVKLYREDDSGVEELKNDPRLRILNEDTGDLLSGPDWKRAVVRDYLLPGAGYAYCNMRRSKLESLHYVKCRDVSVSVNADPIFKNAVFLIGSRTVFPYELVRICRHTRDGVKGHGILDENSTALAVAYNYLLLENTLAKTGGNKRGFLQSEAKLNEEQINALKHGFEGMYSNSSSGVIVLNKGVAFNPASSTAVELQLNENKKSMREEICSLFCLPPSIITGSASEIEFQNGVKAAVLPILDALEKALNRAILLESERNTHYFSFDSKALMKGDIEKRYRAYSEAVRAGWLSKNEIRYEEDYQRIEGLDVVSMSLGDVIFDIKTGKYYVPNKNEQTALDEVIPKGGEQDEN